MMNGVKFLSEVTGRTNCLFLLMKKIRLILVNAHETMSPSLTLSTATLELNLEMKEIRVLLAKS